MRLAGAILLAFSFVPVQAQTTQKPTVEPVLVIQQDRLFETSAFGRAAKARLDEQSRLLIAENRRIEQELEAEERNLTERRAILPPAEFRSLADSFNARVETIRSEQDAKSRMLAKASEDDRKRFLEAAVPVLVDLMREKGAALILDQNAVFLSLETIDITDEAVERINAKISDGKTGPSAPAPSP